MTAILRQLPFQEKEDEVSIGLERVRVKPYQIIAWVSVTPRSVLELPPQAPRMPVIVDTGHSHHFSIQERHLAEWARLMPGMLPQRGTITVDDLQLPLHAAAVWMHPNQRGMLFFGPYDADDTFRALRDDDDTFSRPRQAASIPRTSWRVTSRNGPARAARYRFVARLKSPAFS